jgi:hypothetical protein
MNALFLRHEGFLGAVGAFLKVHPMQLAQPGAGGGGSRPSSGNRGVTTTRAHRSKVGGRPGARGGVAFCGEGRSPLAARRPRRPWPSAERACAPGWPAVLAQAPAPRLLQEAGKLTGTPPSWFPPLQVRARFVERFSMGAPFAGGAVHGPAIRDMSDRVSWVEKFVAAGAQAHEAATEQKRRMGGPPVSARPGGVGPRARIGRG